MPRRQGRNHGLAHGRGRGRRGGGKGGATHAGAEESGSERWLVTYADMLTLLLVLFIVLFSISVVNTSKFIELRSSLASAFGDGPKSVLNGGQGILDDTTSQQGQDTIVPGTPADPLQIQAGKANTDTQNVNTTVTPVNLDALARKQVENFKKIERAVNHSLDRHGMAGDVQFSMDRRGLVMTVVTDALVFPGNSAVLQPEGQRIVAAIAPPLRHIANRIAVNGYTNQLPADTYPYPTGWELSSARAAAVVRRLIGDGIAEKRLSATGYNDLDPLVAPGSPHAATRNRRVDIVVMSNLPDAAGNAMEAAVRAAKEGAP